MNKQIELNYNWFQLYWIVVVVGFFFVLCICGHMIEIIIYYDNKIN
jgi:hypothetical protein